MTSPNTLVHFTIQVFVGKYQLSWHNHQIEVVSQHFEIAANYEDFMVQLDALQTKKP